MRIPAKTDYALRAAVALAGANGGFVKAGTLSRTEAIPFEYLQNILRDLRRAGLLAAQRGYDGGYRLARPAASITVSEVLEAVQSPLMEPYTCAPGTLWDSLELSAKELFGSTTIADLAAP
jgi:Rrf2 family protein